VTAPPLVAFPDRPEAAGPLQRVARGGALNLAGAVANATIGVGVTWLAVRVLSPAQAGALFTATATFVLAANVAKLGTQTGLVYWIARLRSLGQHHLVPVCVRVGVLPVLAASVLTGAALWYGVPLLTGLADHEHAGAFAASLRALALFLPLAALCDALLAATRGFRAMRPTVAVDRLIRPGLQILGFAVLTVAASYRPAERRAPDLILFALAWVAPYAPAAVLAAIALRRTARVDGAGPVPAGTHRGVFVQFWRFTWPRAVANVVQTALQRVDVLLVAGLAGLRAAAIYAVAGRFILVGQFANQAIAQSVQPRLAEVLTVDDRDSARLLYRTGTAWLVLLAWPLYLLVAVFAPVYLGAFGPRYLSGALAVMILAVAMMVATACGMVDMVLAMAGRTTWNLFNVSAALTVMVAVDLLLVPRMGPVGAAIGLAAAMLTNNLVPLMQIFGLLGLHPFGAGTLAACGLALLCFGALPAVAVATVGRGPAAAAVAVVAGGAAYAVGCWRLRRLLRLTAFLAPRREVAPCPHEISTMPPSSATTTR
jgi:O-antigen/teichoic acid export membrane protein